MATSPWKELAKALQSLAKSEKPKKAKKAKKPKKPKPKHWHNQPKSPATAPSDAGDPWKTAHAATGGEMPFVDLVADHPIGGTLLDLAGEGKIGLQTALAAWQRDQERITNRVWRRPGGLQRMAGL